MADIQRTIVAKLRLDEEGDAELFGKTADEVAKLQDETRALGVAGEGLGKAFEQGTRAVESGATRAVNAVKNIGVALENYRQQLKAAEAAGATIGAAQVTELRRLEAEYAKAVASAGHLAAAEQRARKDINEATEAAGGQVQAIRSLDDLFRQSSGTLAEFATKVIAVGVSLKAAQATVKEAVDGLNALRREAGQTEDAYRRLGPGIAFPQESFREWKRLLSEGTDYVDQHTRAVNDEVEAYRKAQAAYLAVIDPKRQEAQATRDAAKATEEWIKAEGMSGEALGRTTKALIDRINAVADANKQLKPPEIAALFAAEIDKVIAQYQRLRLEVPKQIQDQKLLADAWREASAAATLSAEQQVRAAGLIPEKLKAVEAQVRMLVETYRMAGQTLPPMLAEQAAALGIFTHAWERVREAVDLTNGTITGGTAGLAAFNAELERGVSSAEAYLAAARRLQQTIDGVGSSAHLAAGEVAGIFLGTPQIAGTWADDAWYKQPRRHPGDGG